MYLLLLMTLFGVLGSASLDPIVIKGSKFFYETNGTQFFIKGVAYQQNPKDAGASTKNVDLVDALADGDSCKRDIPFLQQLGANLVRVYAIDPTQDHSVCMGLLDDAGIYVLSELANNKTSISSEKPTWDVHLYEQYASVVDTLQKYSNVIGFSVGNEVVTSAEETDAAAFVKAAARDVKAYIKSKGYRSSLGVGYAHRDLNETLFPSINTNMARYFNCGDDTNTVDFWGYNIYSWCGTAGDMENSGYGKHSEEFATYSAPVFFSEYGCNNDGAAARPFTEVKALYGDQMSSVFSGGVAYEYFQEEKPDPDADYGLVSVVGNSISTLADFNALATQLAAANPTGVNAAQYKPINTAKRTCPTVDSNWHVAAKGLPQTPNPDFCSCMMSTLSCQAKSTLTDKEMDSQFSWICGPDGFNSCAGFSPTTENGDYPPGMMCNGIDKLSWAFNAYFQYYNSKPEVCNFTGNATLVTPSKSAAACSSLLNVAVPTGISTSTSTGGTTGPTGHGSTTTSGTGSTKASSSATTSSTNKSSAGNVSVSSPFSFTGLGLGVYVLGLVALGGGAFAL